MKDKIKINVRNGLGNIKLWFEIKYNCDYPTNKVILDLYDNDWIVRNIKTSEEDYWDYEDMDEDVLRKELDRLRSLKSNK